MDILDSLRSEFDVINEKLDFIVIAIKEKEITKTRMDRYVSIDARRENINYNEE